MLANEFAYVMLYIEQDGSCLRDQTSEHIGQYRTSPEPGASRGILELTNSCEHPSYGLVVLVNDDFVLAKYTSTNTLDNTNLGALLVLKLSQTEGEGTELLDYFRQEASRGRALELVGGSRTSVQSSPVAIVLDLAASETDTHLNTPHLTDLRKTVTPDTFARRKDNLLLGFYLVVVELPDGSALDEVAAVGLDNLLKHVGHLALGVGLLCCSLLLLFFIAVGDQAWRHHQPQQELVGVVCSQKEICLASGDFLSGANNDIVANNCAETIDLGAQLNLDNLSLLQCRGGFLGVGLEWCVWGDVGAWGDGGAVSNALHDLLALVDLGNLLV